jgi:hypothetical protein
MVGVRVRVGEAGGRVPSSGGVSEAVGVGDGVPVALGVGEGEAVRLAVGLAVGVAVRGVRDARAVAVRQPLSQR